MISTISLTFGGMTAEASLRPQPRPPGLHVTATAQWDFRAEGKDWTDAALAALRDHGGPLVRETPRDITDWCPGYRGAPDAARRAFWVGFMSALAFHESSWRPDAVGGNGAWYGLLQILPATARGYGCRAQSGDDLKDGGDNLSCAVRIMAVTVPRDGVVHAQYPRWGGVSADWGPMRSEVRRAQMARWVRAQPYCQLWASPPPRERPDPGRWVQGPRISALRPQPRPTPAAPSRLAAAQTLASARR